MTVNKRRVKTAKKDNQWASDETFNQAFKEFTRDLRIECERMLEISDLFSSDEEWQEYMRQRCQKLNECKRWLDIVEFCDETPKKWKKRKPNKDMLKRKIVQSCALRFPAYYRQIDKTKRPGL